MIDRIARIAFVALPFAFAPACDSGGGETEEEEHGNLAEEACEHMAEGPFEAITATEDTTGAPQANHEHTRVDVTLVPVDGGNGGLVAFASPGGHHVFFLDRDVPFAVLDPAGAEIAIEASEPVDLCPEVAVSHEVPLEVGLHHLRFGPTPETAVGLVSEAEGE